MPTMLGKAFSIFTPTRLLLGALALLLSGAPAFAGEPVLVSDANGVPTITDRATGDTKTGSSTTVLPGKPSTSASRLLPRARDENAYDRLIIDVAERYEISPALLKAVCLVESAMNSSAVSPKGAMGLMQLTSATARSLGVRNPFDPSQALDGGARYLRDLIGEFGTVQAALAAYLNGPGVVRRLGGIPSNRETWAYIEKVLLAYDYFLRHNPIGLEETEPGS